MATPLSIHKSKWTSFDGFSSTFFNDDFCHDNLATWKAKAVSTNGASFRFKQNFNWLKTLDTRNEIKFWFPQENRFIFSKLDNTSARVHFDNGTTIVHGRKFNFYGSFVFQRNWTDLAVRVGAAHLSEKCNSDNRLRIDAADHKLTWYHKTLVNHNEIRFGVVGVVDLTNRVLLKKDLLLGYVKGQYEVYLKAEQCWNNPTRNWSNLKEYFTAITASTVFNKSGKETYGLQVAVNPVTQSLAKASLVAEYRPNFRTTLKTKLDNDTSLTVVAKRKINNQSTLSFGTSFALTDRSKQAHKIGVEAELNI